jgi:predicted nucleic acid-binding protein
MYAAGSEHPYKASCAWVMREIAAGRLEAVVDTEIVQEVLYLYGALEHWRIGAVIASELLAIVPHVHPVMAEDIRSAIDLFAEYGPRGVAARDVIHVAVMRHHGLTHVISTDVHFDQFEGVVRLDPHDLWEKRSAGADNGGVS